MKFKVKKNSITYKKLLEFKSKMISCDEAAKSLVESVGGEKYCRNKYYLYGGISAVQFESKPENWRVVGQKWQRLYYPKSTSKNKKLFEALRELPVLEHKELNNIVNFKGPQTISCDEGLAWIDTVGLQFGKNSEILIETANGCEYTPNKDIVEILESEFEKLKKEEE